MKPENLNFSIRLRGRLEKMGIRQIDLANELGASKAAVNFWLKGENQPKNEHRKKLAEILEVSYEWLYEGPNASLEKLNRVQENVNEGLAEYNTSSRTLNINPDFQPPPSDLTSVEEIDDFLLPWREAASRSARIAAWLLMELEEHFPHSKLEKHKQKYMK